MKCSYCEEEIQTIFEVLHCRVSICRQKIEVPAIDDEERVSYSVLCSQHQNILFLTRKKIFQWIKLIEKNDNSGSDSEDDGIEPIIEEVD